ncbi:MAG TPA: hypothetical protein VFT22_39260 [Kofleriaceae bacterium]|nr:hypothetical protein [Kofleriaceae bacterium]
MKHPGCLVLAVLATLARTAFAQSPAPPPRPGDAPPGDATPPAPAASEPVLEPERVTSAPPAAPANAPADQEMTLDRLVVSASNHFDLNFFGDVSLVQLDDDPTAFAIGPVGFQLTARLAERLVGRTEYVVKFQNNDTVIDLERLYLEYPGDRWTLVVGRTHTELGYWNTAFHHGTWLQLTIKRPRVLGFEGGGGVLAMHQTGITLSYHPRRGDSGLEAVVSVGNGRGRTIDLAQDTEDNNWAKSLLVRVGAVGIGHPALRFGANVVVDTIAPEPATVRPLLPDKSMFELVTGVFLALRSEQLVVYSETYNVLHAGGGKTWQFTDGFLLAGYRFGPIIPFGEIEVRYGDGANDPYYRPDPAIGSASVSPGNFAEGTLGARYEVNAWSALKLEVSAISLVEGSDYRAELNWSFGR